MVGGPHAARADLQVPTQEAPVEAPEGLLRRPRCALLHVRREALGHRRRPASLSHPQDVVGPPCELLHLGAGIASLERCAAVGVPTVGMGKRALALVGRAGIQAVVGVEVGVEVEREGEPVAVPLGGVPQEGLHQGLLSEFVERVAPQGHARECTGHRDGREAHAVEFCDGLGEAPPEVAAIPDPPHALGRDRAPLELEQLQLVADREAHDVARPEQLHELLRPGPVHVVVCLAARDRGAYEDLGLRGRDEVLEVLPGGSAALLLPIGVPGLEEAQGRHRRAARVWPRPGDAGRAPPKGGIVDGDALVRCRSHRSQVHVAVALVRRRRPDCEPAAR
mmetsp:Transcript_79632/g.257958  ORF Transcript_79632/g.257958 Transcript_79632/m.257958 type:complete len:336 (+) Transcript_79632:1031-2038(+)